MNSTLAYLPPMPPYEGLHPIVVHFPIALLSIVPVFILLAAVWKSQSRAMLTSGLVLCVIGTGMAFLATSTGEATEQFAEAIPSAKETLHEHEELAELARNLFIVVTGILGLATGLAWLKGEKIKPTGRIVGAAVLLGVFVYPLITLANAAHEGGKLVHLHGVKAPLAEGTTNAPAPPSGEETDGD
jgi:uncharacterized membrane protein